MAELEQISAPITVDASKYIEGMNAVIGVSETALEAMDGVTGGSEDLVAGMEAAADSTEEAAGRMEEALGADISRRAIKETLHLLGEFKDKMVEATAAMDPAAGERWEQSMAQLHDATDKVLADLGERLLPVLESVAGAITNAVDAWNSLDESTKDIIATVVEVAGGLIAASAALAYLEETAMLLAPIFTAALPEVLAVGAAVAAGVIIFEELKHLFQALQPALQPFFDYWRETWQSEIDLAVRFGQAIGLIGPNAQKSLGDTSGVLDGLGHGFAAVGNIIGLAMHEPLILVLKAIADIEDGFKHLVDAMPTSIQEKLGLKGFSGGTGVRAMAEGLEEASKHMGDDMLSSLKNLPNLLKNDFKDFGKDVGLDKLLGGQHGHVVTQADKTRNAETEKTWREVSAINDDILKAHRAYDAQKEADEEKLAALQHSEAAKAEQDRHDAIKEQEAAAQRHQQDLERQLAAAQAGGGGDINALKSALDESYATVTKAAGEAVAVDQKGLDSIQQRMQYEQSFHEIFQNDIAQRLASEQRIAEIQKEHDAAAAKLLKDQIDHEKQKQKEHDAAVKKVADYQSGPGFGAMGAQLAGDTQFGHLATDVGAASAGGPVAMAAVAGKDLLEASEGGKKLIESINHVFQMLADTLGKLVEPLIPIVDAIGQAPAPVFDAFGKILGDIGSALAGIIEPLVEPLTALMGPVGELLNVVEPLLPPFLELVHLFSEVLDGIDPFTIVLKALGPALHLVAEAAKYLVEGIAWVWNGILHAIESVFDALAHALPGDAGDVMRGFYNDLVGMEIHVGGISGTAETAAQRIQTLGDAADHAGGIFGLTMKATKDFADKQAVEADALDAQFGGRGLMGVAMHAAAEQAQKTADAFQGTVDAGNAVAYTFQQINDAAYQSASAKLDADQQHATDLANSLDYARSHGASKDVIAELEKEWNAALAQVAIDTAKANAASVGLQQRDPKAAEDQMSLALVLEAQNTIATAQNTQGLNDLTASMTNVPAAFKVAQVADQVLSGQWDGAGGGGDTSGMTSIQQLVASGALSGVTVNGNIYVQADDENVFKSIKRKLLREKQTRTGSSPRAESPRHALDQG